jgi:DNA polymerase-1
MYCPCDEKEKNCCQIPKIKSAEIVKQLEPVLRQMEKTGVLIDVKRLAALSKEVGGKINQLRKEILKDLKADINLDSPSQLADLLFNQLKLPTEDLKRTKSGFSTAASELFKIKSAHPAIKKILKYRELTKLESTYLKPLPRLVDGQNRLHTHYAQEARTGRLSSSNPNLQNIPIKGMYGAEIRKTIIAGKGNKLVTADYSQIELRIVACLANDWAMLEAFKNGEDIHAQTASFIFHKPIKEVTKEERNRAKTINFGILYGMSPFGLSQALSIPQEEAAGYIMEYFHTHKGVSKYIKTTIEDANKNGYVETLFGYRRKLDNLASSNRNLKEADERMAVNTPIQGTAAEILKLSMTELNKALVSKKLGDMILTVHDELVVETPSSKSKEVADLMKKVMEGVVKMCVPIIVEVGIGDNWAESK